MTDISVGEIARQVQAAMTRLEGLTRKIEDSFVSNKLFELYTQGVVDRDRAQDREISEKASQKDHDALAKRVADLEDDRKWLIRLVIGFIILGVLAFFLASGGVNQ